MVVFAQNFVFYGMETKLTLTGSLMMQVSDDIGPVESELMFSLILFGMAYFGTSGLHKTVGETFGVPAGSPCPLHVVCEYKWGFFLGLALCLL